MVNRTYCQLGEIKDRLGLTSSNTARDSFIEQMKESASRWIDTQCGRRFYSDAETRYYTPEYRDLIMVDDLLSITTLKTDEDGDGVFEITWASTDYQLEPRNALYMIPPSPYVMVRVTVNGDYVFPILNSGRSTSSAQYKQQSVEIVGQFGYALDVPDMVTEACVLKTIQLYRRRFSSGEKSGGNSATGQAQAPSDKTITELLMPFMRGPI